MKPHVTKFLKTDARARDLITFLGLFVILLTSCELINTPPLITIEVEDENPLTLSTQKFTAVAEDIDEDPVNITWEVSAGNLLKNTGEEVRWTAPSSIQDVIVRAIASDRKAGGTDTAEVILSVMNNAPVIKDFSVNNNFVIFGNSVTFTASAAENDGEDFIYDFFTSPPGIGTMFHLSPDDNTAVWQAPDATEFTYSRAYKIVLKVSDEQNFFATDTLDVLVYAEFGTIWIADSHYNSVRKYTARGDLVLTSSMEFGKPVALTNNIRDSYGCYVADYLTGEIIQLSDLGEPITTFTDMPWIVDLEVHQNTGTLWALSVGNRALTVIDIKTDQEIGRTYGFSQPQSVAINQVTGDVWISDIGTNTIYRFDAALVSNNPLVNLPDTISSTNVLQYSDSLDVPYDIAVRDADGAPLFIADRSDRQVEQLNWVAIRQEYEFGPRGNDFADPNAIAVTDGEVWVLNSNGAVQHFAENNLNSRTSIDAYVFQNPQVIIVDANSDAVWIGDNGTHQVVKMEAPDSLAVIISGFRFIEDIAVNK